MLKKTMMTAAAAVLMFNVNTLTASAYTPLPGSVCQGAGYCACRRQLQGGAAGSAWRRGNRVRRNRGGRRGSNRGRNIGLGIAAGIIGLGAAAAAADAARRDRRRYGRCERVERRCARRHGWETRRFPGAWKIAAAKPPLNM
jgi:hypothetical protein